MVKVQDTHLQMVLLRRSLGLKGVQLLLRLFPSIPTSTNQDAILEDLLLIPLRPLLSVGSGLITKDIASHQKKLYTWMEWAPTPFFSFFFGCAFLHLPLLSFLHHRSLSLCFYTAILLVQCCVFSGSCFSWLVHFISSPVWSISKGSLQLKFKNKMGWNNSNWWAG